jgi:Holliday junction DNA helicase RuvA
MIGRITGKVTEKMPGALLVGAGPLEYEIFVAAEDWGSAVAGSEHAYYIYEQIREDAHNLFGFSTLAARELFLKLLAVSGIGPKVALAVLSSASIERLRQGIASGDSDLLKGIAGVGKKTAERIIVELRGKLKEDELTGMATSGDSAYQALVALGYSAVQAAEAVAQIPEGVTSDQERIKKALQVMR